MSSLLKHVMDRKPVAIPEGVSTSDIETILLGVAKASAIGTPINCTSVADACDRDGFGSGKIVSLHDLAHLPLTPQFPALWLESAIENRHGFGTMRAATVVFRHTGDALKPYEQSTWKVREAENSHHIQMFCLSQTPYDSCFVFSHVCRLWLGSDGKLNYYDFFNVPVGHELPGVMVGLSYFNFIVAIHTLARLNCKNVSLVAEGPKQFKPGKERKGIVWHTIKVDSVPKFRMRIGGPEVNHIQYRSHWVRGHYADYSKGNGLFGKYKGVYWMPEHQRGSEDVGEVIADYEVA